MLLAVTVLGLSAQQNPPPPQLGGPDNANGGNAATGTYDAGADPGPNRGVARISLINGDVSVRRGDSGDVVAASSDAPLMVQDSLLTSSSSRAELQFDPGTMLRVGASSEVRMAALDNHSYQLQLATGTITFRVFRTDSQSEIDTPSVAVRPLGPGTYRVTVREDGSTQITVRDGEAEIASANGTQRLGAQQTMVARGTPQEAEFQTMAQLQLDAWDHWNLDRDRLVDNSRSAQYVGPDVSGTEELDNNGRWLADPNYGQVWTPNTLDPNWAPYRNGDWTWEDYYGWTWVSADPWGWAPYHYGRWFHGGAGWCWWPGPVYGRHFWAPAYVGFFGFGGGGGFGFGFGHLGWVALAPFESFHPWWGRGWNGHNIFENSRLVNNVNVSNSFRNARVTNGITGVAAGQFGRRGGTFSSFSGSQIQNAGLVHGLPPIAPGRASLALSNRAATGNYPQTANRQFFSRSAAAAPAARSFNSGNAGQSSSGAHDWSRFGTPIHGAPATAPQSNGWRSFGTPATGTARGGSAGYQPLRINPSIVQQRAPSYAAPAYRGAPAPSYGGGYAAPNYRAPAPSYSNGGGGRTAPSFNGGGRTSGGGSSGGGGHAAPSGGGHSSGGGGGHHR
jgi:FecR protein